MIKELLLKFTILLTVIGLTYSAFITNIESILLYICILLLLILRIIEQNN